MEENYGVLLVNLGTPDSPTPESIRTYLREFLSDTRVVDTNPIIWYFVLNCIILPRRPNRLAGVYQSIWMEDGSPLLVYSKKIQAALQSRMLGLKVELAMNYGNPSMQDAIDNLQNAGVDNIIILPLYPQYSCATCGAVYDSVSRILFQKRNVPSLHFQRDYANHPMYIDALCLRIREHFLHNGEPDLLLFSYHGIPQRYVDEGDDYEKRCILTTDLVVKKLSIDESKYMICYQSRFGRDIWLMPYTGETIADLPGKGIKHLQVICPGFSADCIETIVEIEKENREIFLNAGGEKYSYIRALNDDKKIIDMLEDIINSKLPRENFGLGKSPAGSNLNENCSIDKSLYA